MSIFQRLAMGVTGPYLVREFALDPAAAGLLAGRALVGLGTGGVYVPALKVLCGWFRPRSFATVTGTFIAVGNLGGLAATHPLAVLLQAVGWRASFLLAGTVTVLLAIAATSASATKSPSPARASPRWASAAGASCWACPTSAARREASSSWPE